MSDLRAITGGASAPLTREDAALLAQWARGSARSLKAAGHYLAAQAFNTKAQNYERMAKGQPVLRLIKGGRAA